MNLNKSCIEITQAGQAMLNTEMMNLNKSCIEMRTKSTQSFKPCLDEP